MGAAGGEGPPVAQPFDAEGDRQVCVAGAQEVPVHGVDRPVRFHRPLRRDDRLGQHLAAEDPPARLLFGRADEDLFVGVGAVGVGKVQQLQQHRRRIGVFLNGGHVLSLPVTRGYEHFRQ